MGLLPSLVAVVQVGFVGDDEDKWRLFGNQALVAAEV